MEKFALARRPGYSPGRLLVIGPVVGRCRRLIRLPKNGQHLFQRHDEQPIIRLKLDRDRIARVKEDFVVLADGEIFISLDLFGDGNYPTGKGWDFVVARQDDARLGFTLVVIFSNDDSNLYVTSQLKSN